MSVVPYLPYSPALAPADFFLFSKLKLVLIGQQFSTVEDIKDNSLKAQGAIQPEEVKRSFSKLKRHRQKCIDVNVEYFEGDKSRLSKVYSINLSPLTNDSFHLKLPLKTTNVNK